MDKFTNKRYITRGVAVELGLETQFSIWKLIDDLAEVSEDIDYLQVFEIKSVTDENKENKLKVIHTTEQPKYKQEWLLDNFSNDVVGHRIYVIDDGSVTTMLLSDEY